MKQPPENMFQTGWEQRGSSRHGRGWCPGWVLPEGGGRGERQPGFPKLGSLGPASQGRKLSLEVGNLIQTHSFLKGNVVAQLKKEREKGCLSFQAESGFEDRADHHLLWPLHAPDVGFGDTVPGEVLSTGLGVCVSHEWKCL